MLGNGKAVAKAKEIQKNLKNQKTDLFSLVFSDELWF